MKDFFKITFATVLGIIISTLVLTFLGVMTIFGLASSKDTETVVKKNSIFQLDLNGTIAERTQQSPIDVFSDMMSGNTDAKYGLDDIITSIKKAKEEDNIKGIYIKAGSVSAQPATLAAIRRALEDFKESGKIIVSYGDNYAQGAYYISSLADKILVNPKGTIDWHGMAGGTLFYKSLLEKLGVEMQVFKVGTFKSAVEPYILDSMSDANREQVTAYITSIWNQITADVASSRGISQESLNSFADSGAAFLPAEEYISFGIADSLVYKNDVKSYIKNLIGLAEKKDLNVYNVNEMKNVKRHTPKDKSGNIIAVYYATGEIDNSSSIPSSDDGISSSKTISDLKDLQEDEDVKAVVLRVNSPGGSAQGSEQIWYAVSQLKTKKPVIVSMGDYAASGGYYISCNADTIVAEPTTLTGSIGIFGMMPNFKDLSDKFGVTMDVVKTNDYADMGMNMMRPMTDGEKRLMQSYINNGYNLFLQRCADGRGMTKEDIDKIAQGRVWTGEKAKELGLVDILGGLDDAINIAVEKAGVENYTLMKYPKIENGLFKTLANMPSSKLKSGFSEGTTGKIISDIERIQSIGKIDKIQARIPFDIVIY